MGTITEQGSGPAGGGHEWVMTPSWPAELDEAQVREVIVELARFQYALRSSCASVPEAAALAARERVVVAALRS